MSVINEFIRSYKGNVNRYETLAQTCAHLCERELKRMGLRALVTYRAKRLDSLIAKVENRSLQKAYTSVAEIYDDILDLAGVRIALFFPEDQDEVDSFIRATFLVDQVKDFPQERNRMVPYPKRFSGYSARHYRLRLKKEALPPAKQHLSKYYIEVQLGSVLMHAWAEIEHDLVYKSTPGLLSQAEYVILDELNGLMQAGEKALGRLQQAVKKRVNNDKEPFANHYELASFLQDYLKASIRPPQASMELGRVDTLFHFLEKIKLNSASHLYPILLNCSLRSPLAQQIVDQILQENPNFYQAYNQSRLLVSRTDPFAAPEEGLSFFAQEQGRFLKKWIALERMLGKQGSSALNPATKTRLQSIRQLRADILYNRRWPGKDEISTAEDFLDELRRYFLLKNQRTQIHNNRVPTDLKQPPEKEFI